MRHQEKGTPDKFSLTGTSGVVTDPGTGIGIAVARGLTEAGADVVIAGCNLQRLEQAHSVILRFAPCANNEHSIERNCSIGELQRR